MIAPAASLPAERPLAPTPPPPGGPKCPFQTTQDRRRRRGRRAHLTGLSVEDQVARDYQRKGATVRAQRCRTPEGELDLIVEIDGLLAFVEVKARKTARMFDGAISARQWQRLECAAIHYMMDYQNETGVQPFCRFDVAFVGPDGTIEVIENARSFD